MTDDVILAVDGGGSRTRCLAITRAGAVRGRAETGPSNDLQIGAAAAVTSVERAVEDALAAADVPRDRVAAVAAGLAGVDADGFGAERWADAFGCRGFPTAFVFGDMIAAHRGALAGAPGVVALAGTGSVVVGIGEDGAVVKVGGWGPVYGNEGSAYWIGREGLRAAARAADGRGPKTALGDRLGEALGVPTFARSIDVVYATPLGQQEIAALAPHVCAAAERGDVVARGICLQAAADLVESVRAALRRLRTERSHIVSYHGAILLECARIRAAFEAGLRQVEARVDIRPPQHAPVVGAFLLGCRALGWDPAPALRRLASTGPVGATQP